MAYKVELFKATEKKSQHEFIELSEDLWKYVYESDFSSVYFYNTDERIIAVADVNGRHFWVNTVGIHHHAYEVHCGLIGVNIGDFIQFTEDGLVLWSKELFNDKFVKVNS